MTLLSFPAATPLPVSSVGHLDAHPALRPDHRWRRHRGARPTSPSPARARRELPADAGPGHPGGRHGRVHHPEWLRVGPGGTSRPPPPASRSRPAPRARWPPCRSGAISPTSRRDLHRAHHRGDERRDRRRDGHRDDRRRRRGPSAHDATAHLPPPPPPPPPPATTPGLAFSPPPDWRPG